MTAVDQLNWSDLGAAQRTAVLELLTQGWTLSARVVVEGLEARGLVEHLGGELRLTPRGRELAGWALTHERARGGRRG